MNSYIHPKKMLYSSEFVSEPVNEICENLEKTDFKKIILNSGRGTGKSTVLYNLQDRGIGRDKQYIYTNFDAASKFSYISKTSFYKEFLIHYYEIVFSLKLLEYIRINYNVIYNKYFLNINGKLNILSHELDYFINNYGYYDNIKIDRYLSIGEISKNIISLIKKYVGIDFFGLIVDRFDWINGNEELSQHIISSNFDNFDKVIITSDDNTIVNNYLSDYYITNITYSRDIEEVKKIINRRIDIYNDLTNIKKFDKELFTDDIYEYLIIETNGNIKRIIDILRNTITIVKFQDVSNKNDIRKIVELELYEDNEVYKEIYKPKKLCL